MPQARGGVTSNKGTETLNVFVYHFRIRLTSNPGATHAVTPSIIRYPGEAQRLRPCRMPDSLPNARASLHIIAQGYTMHTYNVHSMYTYAGACRCVCTSATISLTGSAFAARRSTYLPHVIIRAIVLVGNLGRLERQVSLINCPRVSRHKLLISTLN